jgi:hypothetical protein
MDEEDVYDTKSTLSQGADEGDVSSVYSGTDNQREDDFLKIGNRETNTVWKLKVLVVLVVLAATVATACAVYLYTSRSEQAQFESQFQEYAYKVLDSVGTTLEKTIGAMDALAVDTVSHARSTDQTWPFVNIPFFSNRAAKVLSISNSLYLILCPVITPENRLEWEAFTTKHGRSWVDEYMALQKTDDNYYGPIIEEYNISSVIYGDFGKLIVPTVIGCSGCCPL